MPNGDLGGFVYPTLTLMMDSYNLTKLDQKLEMCPLDTDVPSIAKFG